MEVLEGYVCSLVDVSDDAFYVKWWTELGLRFSGMVFGRPRDASTLSTLHLRPVTMEVHLFTRIFIWSRVDLFLLAVGSGTKQLIHRCGGQLHHVCSGPQEENQSLGAYDRTLCFRREDSRTIQISISR
jgi:hypothetical protein